MAATSQRPRLAKELASSDLAEETRRMEAQLGRIRSEQQRLKSMVPAALPGTTRWSSAALPLEAPSRAAGPARAPPSLNQASALDGAGLFSLFAAEAAAAAAERVSAAGGSGLRAVASLRRRGSSGGGGGGAAPARPPLLQPSQASAWTVAQVGDWLALLGLEKYASDFAKNEVTGAVLLDFGAGDLDYLNITALGPRKALLKGVDQLRAAAGVATPAIAPSSASASASASSPGRVAVSGEARDPAASPAKVHWSQVAPMAPMAPTASDAAASSRMLHGELDEDAERRAFQAAVQAWRNSGKSGAKVSSVMGGTSGDGGWLNPADLASGGGGGGGALLHGSIDEEAEHRAFQEAVNEWRTGGVSGGAKAGGAATAPTSSSTASSSSQSASAGAGVSSAAAGGGGAGGARASCYHCFRLFFVSSGFQPRPPSEGRGLGDAASEADAVAARLARKAFCSSECHDSACMAALRREAAKTAARAEGLVLAPARSLGGGDGDGDAPLDSEFASGDGGDGDANRSGAGAGAGGGSVGGSSSGSSGASAHGSALLSHSPVTAPVALLDFAAAAAREAAREASDAAEGRRRATQQQLHLQRQREAAAKAAADAPPARAVAAPIDIWATSFDDFA